MKAFSLYLFLIAWVGARSFAGAQIGLTDNEKAASQGTWGPVDYSTQVSIGLKDAIHDFRTNQPIDLVVRIKNLSTNEEYSIYLQNSFIFTEGLSLEVLSPSGKDVSPVFQKTSHGSGGVVWIHPSQTDGFIFDLHEICKMDEFGIYQVSLNIQRRTPDHRKSFDVRSNRLKVKIVP
ncbi:MAG TPA: hypothetical protein VKV04_08505 [Verrucomicrobiae bacterium]|nr:hypothetical protein [Verrucomicrobiae bacterium]